MYHQYFGLNEAPFSIAVNPRYLFMSARHRDALAHLLYGVGAGGGFILLTGEVGTGKTTINRCLLEQLPQDTDIAIILNPALNALELLATACDELNIDYDPDKHTLKTLTDKLHTFLLDNHSRGRNTVLMIDEAQHLDFDVLEQIRLLTNLETNTRKLLQIILIGQPELVDLLNRPELRQLNQRITARYNLEPLNQEETAAYITHRLQVAGMPPGQQSPFPGQVVRGIFKRTRGIPRLINVLCDRILLGTYGRNKMRADMSMLNIATREVMGEETGMSEGSRRSIIMGVAATLVVAVGLWFAYAFFNLEIGGNLPAQSADSVMPSSPPASKPPETLEPPQVTPEPMPVAPVPDTPEPVVNPRQWLLPPEGAFQQLWALMSSLPPNTSDCLAVSTQGIACVEGRAETWSDLTVFNRPLILHLVTPQRFAASVLLLGITGGDGYLLADNKVVSIKLADFGHMWSGDYAFLWHPPRGFERPLAQGDSGPVVAEVARLFAQLDQQEQPLAQQKFNTDLTQRVKIFQRQFLLEDDGVVGLKTLFKLNEQLGIDLTNTDARAQLQQHQKEVVIH
ncbi:MAG: AAA family ATPase [Halioglobus sp.]